MEEDAALRAKAVELAIDAFENTDAFVDGDYDSANITAHLMKLAKDIYNFLKGETK